MPPSHSQVLPLPERHAEVSGLAWLLGCLLMAVVWASLSGAYDIRVLDIAGWMLGAPMDVVSSNVIFNIRLPRVLLGVLAGAALGLSGAVMQSLFRNPLAEPGLVGLSAGASLGAVMAIVLTGGGAVLIGGFAFVGAIGATLLAYYLGRSSPNSTGLLLAGIAINVVVGSAMGIMILKANDSQLRDLTFWNMGSLAAADWSLLGWLAPWTMMVGCLLLTQWRELNALLLGEREAFHLGFHPRRLRWRLIILVAMMVAPVVAVTGAIGFVGLVVPHLVRLWRGADHQWVLPASAMAGALALTLADWLGRTLMSPTELPIGLVTSLIGGPFFIWLLWRGKRSLV